MVDGGGGGVGRGFRVGCGPGHAVLLTPGRDRDVTAVMGDVEAIRDGEGYGLQKMREVREMRER
ncbi:hypothetical protein GCM10010341_22660 [Streptomyces noursei]|nr:hypothetical protein GCM10010341_22660 [Streptomyces noursei]